MEEQTKQTKRKSLVKPVIEVGAPPKNQPHLLHKTDYYSLLSNWLPENYLSLMDGRHISISQRSPNLIQAQIKKSNFKIDFLSRITGHLKPFTYIFIRVPSLIGLSDCPRNIIILKVLNFQKEASGNYCCQAQPKPKLQL